MVYVVTMSWAGCFRTLPYRFAEDTGKEQAQQVADALNAVLSPTFKHEVVELSESLPQQPKRGKNVKTK